MSNNLKIMGKTYNGVSSITAHDATSGTHKYVDTSDTTATAADVRIGEKFYNANGTEIQGTVEEYKPTELTADDITDLSGTVWYLNTTLVQNTGSGSLIMNIPFTSNNGKSFQRLTQPLAGLYDDLWYTSTDGSAYYPYENGAWNAGTSGYRTIAFPHSEDSSMRDTTIINWFKTNATYKGTFDLTNTIWEFKDYSEIDWTFNFSCAVRFISNGTIFKNIAKPDGWEELDYGSGNKSEKSYTNTYHGTSVWIKFGWVNEYAPFRVVKFLENGTTTIDFYNWLKANATLISAEGTVFDGIQINHFDGSTITLPVKDKISIEDIQVYNKKPEVEELDVNFIDYDGTILYSYGYQEFANLSAFPTCSCDTSFNPTYNTAEWNYSTLAAAKTYVASNKKLQIGKQYYYNYTGTLTNYVVRGLRFKIKLEEDFTNPTLAFGLNGSAMINWGDGSSLGIITGNDIDTIVSSSHNYAYAGEFWIEIVIDHDKYMKILGNTHSLLLSQDSSVTTKVNRGFYQNCIKEVWVGNNCYLGENAFAYCSGLEKIILANDTTCMTTIPQRTFYMCTSLKSIIIPDSVTTIGANTFAQCCSLNKISLPYTITSIGENAFYFVGNKSSLVFPSSLTTISTGLCQQAYNQPEIIIPEGVTTIGASAFIFNSLVRKINIPSTVTSIDSKAFSSLLSLQEIRFNSTTPPTILNSDAFDGLQTNAKIYFPVAIDSNNYITNYSDYAYGTNYPGGLGTERFIGYATINNNTNVPTINNWTGYCLWKATKKEAATSTGTTLTKGNGSEIYCYIWDNFV